MYILFKLNTEKEKMNRMVVGNEQARALVDDALEIVKSKYSIYGEFHAATVCAEEIERYAVQITSQLPFMDRETFNTGLIYAKMSLKAGDQLLFRVHVQCFIDGVVEAMDSL